MWCVIAIDRWFHQPFVVLAAWLGQDIIKSPPRYRRFLGGTIPNLIVIKTRINHHVSRFTPHIKMVMWGVAMTFTPHYFHIEALWLLDHPTLGQFQINTDIQMRCEVIWCYYVLWFVVVQCEVHIYTGWWFEPLWKILVKSQLGWLFSIYGKIKNVPNHQPVYIGMWLHVGPEVSFRP